MKLVSATVDYMKVFPIINTDRMKINDDVNAKHLFKKEYVIKDLIEILTLVSVNAINNLILGNIYIIKTASIENVS